MDTKALQLCSRFALPPNQLGYCGKDSAPEKLKKCVINGDCSGVEPELEKFIVLNPYLQTLAQITNLSPFSYEIIEAYWFGNDLINQVKPKHYDLLLTNLAKQGVPDFLITELKTKKPKKFIPIHLFNILHVGVGRASGSVPFNLQSINNCMLRWGTVLKINKNKSTAQVELRSLFLKEGNQHKPFGKWLGLEGDLNPNYQLQTANCQVNFDPNFTPNLKIGDKVAVHWGFIPKILTTDEQKKLRQYTKLLIENI